jgi:hypothetical protein
MLCCSTYFRSSGDQLAGLAFSHVGTLQLSVRCLLIILSCVLHFVPTGMSMARFNYGPRGQAACGTMHMMVPHEHCFGHALPMGYTSCPPWSQARQQQVHRTTSNMPRASVQTRAYTSQVRAPRQLHYCCHAAACCSVGSCRMLIVLQQRHSSSLLTVSHFNSLHAVYRYCAGHLQNVTVL